MPPHGTAEKDPANRLSSTAGYAVVSVEAPSHLHLVVRFADGLAGDVIMKKSHLHGVFQALNDPALFAKVSCAQGFVEWPGEIDLAPDAMHEEIREHGTWILE